VLYSSSASIYYCALLHVCLPHTMLFHSLYLPPHTPCHPLLNVATCPTRPPPFVSCPPSIQFTLRPGQTAASSSTTQHVQTYDSQRCVALEGHQNSRTRNRPRCSCSVLRPLVGPAVPDRQHEQRASIPQPCSPSRLLVCPGSLPASRNCYRRPVRPSRSFKTCHPYHATHATHHSAMHDTPSPPCAHRDRSSAMIFSSSLCTYPAAQKQCIIVQGCLPPHWAPARSLSASIRLRCRSQGCRTSTRARVCRNARPSPSNFVPNEHRPSHTTTRNMLMFAGAP
jgi:hypothetical protein